jgi:DNA-binding NtrC family response regulator
MSLRVLLVDDDGEFRKRFAVLSDGTFTVVPAGSYADGVKKAEDGSIDAALLDIDLRETLTGIDLLRQIHLQDPDLPIVMLSSDERAETIERAFRAGADGYFRKDSNLRVLRAQIARYIENALWRRHAREFQLQEWPLVGSSAPMEALRQEIAKVAATSLRVLIRGESGSGKELVARAIHGGSARRDGRLVTHNAAGGPDELFDDILFGHERGSYTGAERPRVGKIELAQGGTLFLDEVGKMSLGRQAKLLRVIEGSSFERIGGTEPVEADFRLVTASNEPLEERVANSTFAADFFHRIREYQIVVPPLRDHITDLPELAARLLERFRERVGPDGIVVDEGALNPCYGYDWPGNVRELDSVLKRAVVTAGGRLTADSVAAALENVRLDSRPADASQTLRAAHDTWERDFLARALARNGHDATLTASVLGVSRSALYEKLRTHGLTGK